MPFRPSQKTFRGRNDTVGLNSSTFTYFANTNWTQNVDETFRVRFVMQEVGGTANADTFKLRYSLNGGAYTDVTSASSVVRATLSGQYADHDNTTLLLDGTGTFVAGDGLESSTSSDSISLAASGNSEVEYSIQIRSA